MKIVCECFVIMSLKCVISLCLTEPVFRNNALKVNVSSQNTINIYCENLVMFWNGERDSYIAEIQYSGASTYLKEKTSPKCFFEFPDLYYLTSYDIKVF